MTLIRQINHIDIEFPRPVLGGALVLVGALLYAVINIIEEHLLGEHLV